MQKNDVKNILKHNAKNMKECDTMDGLDGD